MRTCIALLALVLPIWSGCERSGDSPLPARPVVFVLDTFEGRDSHGENVSRTLAESCRERCEIRYVSLGHAVKRETYLDALQDILRFKDDHPEARILVNMSFGSYASDPREEQLVENMVQRGIVLVAAAGNDNSDKPMYPAAYSGVLAVAAVDLFGQKELYSNYGEYIGIAAGGFLKTKVVSRELKATGPYHQEYVRYLITGGTSFATPRVCGLIGLLLARQPGLAEAEAVRAIRQTAGSLPDNPYYRGGTLGSGRIDEYEALYRVDPDFRRLVFAVSLGWAGYLAIWGFISVHAWRRKDFFGPFMEGLFLACFIYGGQLYAIWIWGEMTGRWIGLILWAVTGALAVGVGVNRKREEAFVRRYRFEPEILRRLGTADLGNRILCIRRDRLFRYLIDEETLRPDLAERILRRYFGERTFFTLRLDEEDTPPKGDG